MHRLIGRDDVLRRVRAWVTQPGPRLVTITGAGGMGKTRVAREIVASEPSARFVDLSALTDPAEVLPSIARALDLRGDTEQPLLERLQAKLQDAPGLLVLDNFEQVYAAAGDVEALLDGCPNLRLLITSRIALRIPPEHELPLPPLATNAERCDEAPAVALYVERAHAVRPDFTLDATNQEAVAEICRRLDGLPLALELAAARVRILPPRALVSRLDRAMDLITADLEHLPERQRGLRQLVDWSYELLDEAAQRCYARAGAFVGSFDLDALTAVTETCDQPDLLDQLATLVEANLLRQADLDSPEPRYRFLETIRAHALECLDRDPAAESVREQHARFYVDLVEQAEPRLTGHESAIWLARLERERDNLRAALAWSIASARGEIAMRLSGALQRLWFIRADFLEGERWCEQVLALECDDARIRARALIGAGNMAARLGRQTVAQRHFEEGLRLYRVADDSAGIALALNSLGNIAYDRADYATAGTFYRDSLALRRESRDVRGISVALNNIGNVALALGDLQDAAAAHQEALALSRELGDRHRLATSLNNFADVEMKRGNAQRALALAAEALGISLSLGDRWGMAHALLKIADLAVAAGAAERGIQLLAGIERLYALLGSHRNAEDELRFQQLVAIAAGQLTVQRYEACWSRGQVMSDAELVRAALAPEPRTAPEMSPRVQLPGLTEREREVLTLVGRGRTNRQIADDLVISESTAAVHVKHILRKLGCASRAAAAVWAVQNGLLADAA